jgi:hypothetical protein
VCNIVCMLPCQDNAIEIENVDILSIETKESVRIHVGNNKNNRLEDCVSILQDGIILVSNQLSADCN